MADDPRGATARSGATPAVVCGTCREESALDVLWARGEGPASCLHCGSRLGIDIGVPHPVIRLLEALRVGDSVAIDRVLHDDAVWSPAAEPDDLIVMGKPAVRALLLDGLSRHLRSLWKTEFGVVADIVEHRAQPYSRRIVRWRLGIDDGRIVDCVVEEMGEVQD